MAEIKTSQKWMPASPINVPSQSRIIVAGSNKDNNANDSPKASRKTIVMTTPDAGA
ncbi:hypothetical protein [Sodalis-like endosymbiont of Proechinophthirus fluctus]|uniref:hypothetical protein n=1 Tax=Sodalis-like endosymbiont of Proechinophthirus fluctus TaxID=1462730 RepID=UPI000AAFEF51